MALRRKEQIAGLGQLLCMVRDCTVTVRRRLRPFRSPQAASQLPNSVASVVADAVLPGSTPCLAIRRKSPMCCSAAIVPAKIVRHLPSTNCHRFAAGYCGSRVARRASKLFQLCQLQFVRNTHLIDLDGFIEIGESLAKWPESAPRRAFWGSPVGSSTRLSTGHVDNRKDWSRGKDLAGVAQAELS